MATTIKNPFASQKKNPNALAIPKIPKVKVKTSSLNKVLSVQKQNAKNLKRLQDIGLDTSDVTKPKSNPLFNALDELDQMIGTTGSVEFFSRLAEQGTKGGKKWQPGEQAELVAGGLGPWAAIAGGVLAGTAGAGWPIAAAIGGMGLGAALLSYAKGQLGINKYLDYRGSEEEHLRQFIGTKGTKLEPGKNKQAMSTALLNLLDQELNTNLASSPAANIVTGLAGAIFMDNLRLTNGLTEPTKLAIKSRTAAIGLRGIFPDTIAKAIGVSIDEVPKLLSPDALKIWNKLLDLNPKIWGKTAEELKDMKLVGLNVAELTGSEAGRRFLSRLYRGIRKTTMQEMGDYGGLKLLSKKLPSIAGKKPQELYDLVREEAKWGLVNSPTFGEFLRKFRAKTAGRAVEKAMGKAKKAGATKESIEELLLGPPGDPNPAAVFLRSAFGAGGFGPALARSQTTIQDETIRTMARKVSKDLTSAANIGGRIFKKYAKMGNGIDRNIAFMVGAHQFGPSSSDDMKELRGLLTDMRSTVEELKRAQEVVGIDPETGQRIISNSWLPEDAFDISQTFSKQEKIAAEAAIPRLRREIGRLEPKIKALETKLYATDYGPEHVRAILAEIGITGDRADRIMDMVEEYRQDMIKAMDVEVQSGFPQRELSGYTTDPEMKSRMYQYGTLPNDRNAQEDREFREAIEMLRNVEEMGFKDVDVDSLRGRRKGAVSKFAYRSKDEKQDAKAFLYGSDRIAGGFDTEADIGKNAAQRVMRAYNRAGFQDMKNGLYMTMGRPLYAEALQRFDETQDVVGMKPKDVVVTEAYRGYMMDIIDRYLLDGTLEQRQNGAAIIIGELARSEDEVIAREMGPYLAALSGEMPELVDNEEFQVVKAIADLKSLNPDAFRINIDKFRALEAMTNDPKMDLNVPGIYLWTNPDGEVIYVGMSKDLKKRITSYIKKGLSGEGAPTVNARMARDEFLVAVSKLRAKMYKEIPGMNQDLSNFADIMADNPELITNVDVGIYHLIAPALRSGDVVDTRTRNLLFNILDWNDKKIDTFKVAKRYIINSNDSIGAMIKRYEDAGETSLKAFVKKELKDYSLSRQEEDIFRTALETLGAGHGATRLGQEDLEPIITAFRLAAGELPMAQRYDRAKNLLDIMRSIKSDGVKSSWQYQLIAAILGSTVAMKGPKELDLTSDSMRYLVNSLKAARRELSDNDESWAQIVDWVIKFSTTSPSKRAQMRDKLLLALDAGASRLTDASPAIKIARSGLADGPLSWLPGKAGAKWGPVYRSPAGEFEDVLTGDTVRLEWQIHRTPDGFVVHYSGLRQMPDGSIEAAFQPRMTEPLGSLEQARRTAIQLQENMRRLDALGYKSDAAWNMYDELGTTDFIPRYRPIVDAAEQLRDEMMRVVIGTQNGNNVTLGQVADSIARVARKEDGVMLLDNLVSKATGKSRLLDDFDAKIAGIVLNKESEEIIDRFRQSLAFYDMVTDTILSKNIYNGWESYEEMAVDLAKIAETLTNPEVAKQLGFTSKFRYTEPMILGMGEYVPLTHAAVPEGRSVYDGVVDYFSTGARASAQRRDWTEISNSLLMDMSSDVQKQYLSNTVEYMKRVVADLKRDPKIGASDLSSYDNAFKAYINFLSGGYKAVIDKLDPVSYGSLTDMRFDIFRDDQIEEFVRYMSTNGYPPSTINKYLQRINYLNSKLYGRDMRYHGSAATSMISKIWESVNGRTAKAIGEQDAKNVLGVTDIHKLVKKSHYDFDEDVPITELTPEALKEYEEFRDFLIMNILYFTGMREGEFEQLTWRELQDISQFFAIAKGRKVAGYDVIPELIGYAAKFNKKYSGVSDVIELPFSRILKGKNGKLSFSAFNNKTLNDAIRARAVKNGTYDWIASHTLRHSLATHMYDSGASIDEIGKALHHEAITDTEQYIHKRIAPSSSAISRSNPAKQLYYKMKRAGLIGEYVSPDETLQNYMRAAPASAGEPPKPLIDLLHGDDATIPKSVLDSIAQSPHQPGVVMGVGKDGNIMYIEGAADMHYLVNAMLGGGDRRDMVADLLNDIDSFKFIPAPDVRTAMEDEAENIARFQPIFNQGTEASVYKYGTSASQIPNEGAKPLTIEEVQQRLLGGKKPAYPGQTPAEKTQEVTDQAMSAKAVREQLRDGEVVVSSIVGNKRVYFAIDSYVSKFIDEFLTPNYSDDAAFKQFLRFYDTALVLWKRQATILRIGFHTRNKLSNAFLMAMHGFFDPYFWAMTPKMLKGGDDLVDFVGNEKLLKKYGKTQFTYDELVRMAEENRVRVGYLESAEIEGRRVSTDLEATSLRQAIGQGVGYNPFSGKSKVSRGMQYIGTDWVEDADRFSTFLTAMKKGFSDEEAGVITDKVLYDYSPLGLSMFEQSFLKRIFPFYTWMKRNTPAMFHMLVENPLAFQELKRLSEGTFEAYGLDRSIMPDYLAKAAPVFATPIKDARGNNIVLNMGIPIADVNRALDPMNTLSSVAPGIKFFMEYPQNYDLFYEKPIAATPGQKKRMPTMIYPLDFLLGNKVTGPAWDGLLKAIGVVETVDKTTGQKYLAGDAYGVKMMKDLMPLLNTLSKMGVDPLETGEQSITDVFGELAGLKATPYDTETLKRYAAYEDLGDLQAMVGQAKANQMLPSTPQRKKKRQMKSVEEVLGIGKPTK